MPKIVYNFFQKIYKHKRNDYLRHKKCRGKTKKGTRKFCKIKQLKILFYVLNWSINLKQRVEWKTNDSNVNFTMLFLFVINLIIIIIIIRAIFASTNARRIKASTLPFLLLGTINQGNYVSSLKWTHTFLNNSHLKSLQEYLIT